MPFAGVIIHFLLLLYFQFRMADGYDYVLMIIGFIFAVAQGTGFQLNFYILGIVLDIFIETSGQLENGYAVLLLSFAFYGWC